jgi:glycosyltransferase involved in cell wall biosynthesis
MTSTAEGWGMVLTEAQQMGVPVVAMDSFGALHDIIEDGYNGRIVANNDLVAFQNAMTEIMENEAKRKEMALHAIESSKRYEIQHILLQWQKLFEQMKE